MNKLNGFLYRSHDRRGSSIQLLQEQQNALMSFDREPYLGYCYTNNFNEPRTLFEDLLV